MYACKNSKPRGLEGKLRLELLNIFCASPCHAVQRQKLLSTLWFGGLKANSSMCPLLRRSVFFTYIGITFETVTCIALKQRDRLPPPSSLLPLSFPPFHLIPLFLSWKSLRPIVLSPHLCASETDGRRSGDNAATTTTTTTTTTTAANNNND